VQSKYFTPRARRLLVLASGLLGLVLVPATAAQAGTLTTPNWSISKAHPGDTSVRYTWSFTTATTATLSKVEFTVPSGTAGTVALADVYGLPSGGTVSLSGTTVTYSFSAASVAAGVKALVAIDGFTNTSTAGTYSSTVTTYDNGALTPAAVDSATTNSITIDTNTTGATVVVARTASFTNNTKTFSLLMDPSNSSLSDFTKDVTLTLKTNAGAGYTLSVKASALQTSAATYTVQPVTSGLASGVASTSFTTNRWGYTMAALGGDGVGVRQGALATGQYVGYTTAGETAVSAAGPTNNDSITLTNRVKIDYKQPAGTYTSTITYTMVPSY
jgi:hypothetical protein